MRLPVWGQKGGTYQMPDLVRCEADNPNRCQATTRHGQCIFLAAENHKYCYMHGAATAKNKDARLYNIAKYNAKIERFADHTKMKTLTEELAVLRIMLETRLESCQTDRDLLLNSGPLAELVTKIRDTLSANTKLQQALGELLDRQTVVEIAQKIINIVAEEVKDPDTVNAIALKIAEVLE